MTALQLLELLAAEVTTDMANTQVLIRTPDGDYHPYAIDWDLDDIIIDVLEAEENE